MSKDLKFLILDGYPKVSRDQFDTFGVKLAGNLYADLLLRHLPNATYDILYTSDEDVIIPNDEEIKKYAGILWPGCNLTVYHDDDERVTKMKKISMSGFTTGVPQFGSCWASQLAVYIAGGEVKPNIFSRCQFSCISTFVQDQRRAKIFTGRRGWSRFGFFNGRLTKLHVYDVIRH